MGRLARTILVAVLLTGSIAIAFADTAPPASARSQDSVEALALQWFAQMQAGQIDRTQLTGVYSAQLTDALVQETSRYLKQYQYGASPTKAQILRSRSIGDQTFYVVKLLFPRGDAASLLFGFDAEGKITGISITSMAGD
jgi:hypothetical protein